MILQFLDLHNCHHNLVRGFLKVFAREIGSLRGVIRTLQRGAKDPYSSLDARCLRKLKKITEGCNGVLDDADEMFAKYQTQRDNIAMPPQPPHTLLQPSDRFTVDEPLYLDYLLYRGTSQLQHLWSQLPLVNYATQPKRQSDQPRSLINQMQLYSYADRSFPSDLSTNYTFLLIPLERALILDSSMRGMNLYMLDSRLLQGKGLSSSICNSSYNLVVDTIRFQSFLRRLLDCTSLGRALGTSPMEYT